MSTAYELDALIEQLDQALDAGQANSTTVGQPETGTPASDADALDLILDTPARRTQVRRLRDSAVVRQFREDLLNGLVRVDRLKQLLQLVSTVMSQLLRRV